MAAISRSEGYRRARGKEEPALRLAENLLASVGMQTARISDAEENFHLGDLRCIASGNTVEVKGQPIDPNRYPKNFIEVFEDTSAGRRSYHQGGFADLARLLELSEQELAAVFVRRFDIKQKNPPRRALGRLSGVSVSLTSVGNSVVTMYVNVRKEIVYVYSSASLMRMVRCVVRQSGFSRGRGNSNRDTHAVLVSLPDLRWRRMGGEWCYIGTTIPDPVDSMRALLGV